MNTASQVLGYSGTRVLGYSGTWVQVLVFVAVVLTGACTATAREQERLVPRPAVDEGAGSRSTEVAVVAGGCFWGVQGVYQHTKGVTRAVSGYAGGERATAEYDRVATGLTGHAESVQVTFDPQVITYGAILQIFFSVAHDPTELNQQGPDVGPQYRSALFPLTPEQARVAESYIAQLNDAKIFRRRIATTVETGRTFYTAEDYHQDFLEMNPTYPYIVFNDLPKIRELKRLFPDAYRATPVLVHAR
jgi:peptide-methionine (S)-S-oxide reductase